MRFVRVRLLEMQPAAVWDKGRAYAIQHLRVFGPTDVVEDSGGAGTPVPFDALGRAGLRRHHVGVGVGALAVVRLLRRPGQCHTLC